MSSCYTYSKYYHLLWALMISFDKVEVLNFHVFPGEFFLYVQFSSVVSYSFWPHRLQNTRPPSPSPALEACSYSCPSSWWCHPTISSSVIPFCFQSFPASGSFPVSQFFASGGQSIRASASASVPPMNIQDRFPFGLTGLVSLQSKGLSRVLSNTTVQKHQFFGAQPYLWSNSHIHLSANSHMSTGKTIALTRWTFDGKVMSFLLNTLSRLVIAFLSRGKHLLISWLQSPSAVILEPKKISVTVSHCFPIYLPWSDGNGCRDLRFFDVEF